MTQQWPTLAGVCGKFGWNTWSEGNILPKSVAWKLKKVNISRFTILYQGKAFSHPHTQVCTFQTTTLCTCIHIKYPKTDVWNFQIKQKNTVSILQKLVSN